MHSECFWQSFWQQFHIFPWIFMNRPRTSTSTSPQSVVHRPNHILVYIQQWTLLSRTASPITVLWAIPGAVDLCDLGFITEDTAIYKHVPMQPIPQARKENKNKYEIGKRILIICIQLQGPIHINISHIHSDKIMYITGWKRYIIIINLSLFCLDNAMFPIWS